MWNHFVEIEPFQQQCWWKLVESQLWISVLSMSETFNWFFLKIHRSDAISLTTSVIHRLRWQWWGSLRWSLGEKVFIFSLLHKISTIEMKMLKALSHYTMVRTLFCLCWLFVSNQSFFFASIFQLCSFVLPLESNSWISQQQLCQQPLVFFPVHLFFCQQVACPTFVEQIYLYNWDISQMLTNYSAAAQDCPALACLPLKFYVLLWSVPCWLPWAASYISTQDFR